MFHDLLIAWSMIAVGILLLSCQWSPFLMGTGTLAIGAGLFTLRCAGCGGCDNDEED